ncbi:alpha-L-fucosidase [Nonomuraea sp. NPDC050310]|uniref:alpha-L-fucosidase n=1 Tax=Nonomuraea sp. NPDC050310 TaxID=3154935 RepID=UPI003406394E
MYEPTLESLRRHETPQWFEDAKLGVFLHMGPYSVPAWAPVEGWPAGSDYAEWYWKELNRPGSPTRERHREVYGEHVEYDDFLHAWKAERFDPAEVHALIEAGGARYYVFGAKHHDGVALWDSAVTDRTSVRYGPRRDLVAEVVAATPPGMRVGLYYSIPEWYHPRMPAIGGGWFGAGPPRNAFTGEPVPYTGYRPVEDYVRDHQLPQLLELADRFDPDLMWADIGLGGVNDSHAFMAHYFNRRPDVAVNNRFGNGVYDFTTPEYSVEPVIRPGKWEACRGVGRSFGHNAAEGPQHHLTGAELIRLFADVVSKNGNLLLNLGPAADGTVPELQRRPLLELGAWLAVHGEAMYGSAPWSRPDDPLASVPVRFTTQPHAFYVTTLGDPAGELRLRAPVPVETGEHGTRTEIVLLGHGPAGWRLDGEELVVEVPSGLPPAPARTFRLARPGYDPVSAILLGVTVTAEPVRPGEAAEVTVTLANRGETHAPAGRVTCGPADLATPALAPHTRHRLSLTVPFADVIRVQVTSGAERFGAAMAVVELGDSLPVRLPYDNVGAVAGRETQAGPEVARHMEQDTGAVGEPVPGEPGFTGTGGTYPAELLPPPGPFHSRRVRFEWPRHAPGRPDNLLATGPEVAIPEGARLHLLASAYGRWKPVEARLTVRTRSGDRHEHTLLVGDWRNPAADPIALHLPYVHSPRGEREPDGFVYHHTVPLPPGARSFTLTGDNVHVWAVTVET